MSVIRQLQNNKKDMQQTRIQTRPMPEPGEALLRISRLALTTNNVTYAAFGETPHLRYWDFYPTGDGEWFHMPAWGFAEVVESTVDGLAKSERFYGFWPIASHVVMQPVRVSERGFYDGAEHRLELTSAYNQYQRISSDAAYRAESENYQMLLRPLFITSFMLADFLDDNAFFGARQILMSSASSKTAYGTAFCLQDNPAVQLIGLTSAGNTSCKAWVATIRPWATTSSLRWTRACPRSTSTSPAAPIYAGRSTAISRMRWCTTASPGQLRTTNTERRTQRWPVRSHSPTSRPIRSRNATPTGALPR